MVEGRLGQDLVVAALGATLGFGAVLGRDLSIEQVPAVLEMVSSLPMLKNIVENHRRAENFDELIEALPPGPVRDHALELREQRQ